MAVAMHTARAKVGAKLRAAVMSDPDLRARIDGIPNEDVVCALGTDTAGGSSVDLNKTVLDGLAAFRSWWESGAPGPAQPAVATALLGCYVADHLSVATGDLTLPDWLVEEVTSGRPTKGANSAA
jgi:hypothetical protein